MLQLFLINIGIVDPVNINAAQPAVVNERSSLVVLVSQGFKEVHIYDRGPCGYYAIDHIEPYHVHVNLHTASRAGTSGHCQPVGTILVFDHHLQDVGGTCRIPGRKGHVAHRVYDVERIDLCDVNVFDHIFE